MTRRQDGWQQLAASFADVAALARLVADVLRLVEQSPSIPLDERVHTTSMWAQRARAATEEGEAPDGG